ncbi:MAG TPA: GntR family transcriptional regulator [Alphaproteobacteria bacterium]|nr:GntR family transcriptional regulator [Alphaproteobacteria bacterium]
MARYKELRETLAEEIAAGIHPVGGRFPTEFELCDRFGVSRHTVREALRALEGKGLLSRQAGAGTTVLARASEPHYTRIVGSLEELSDYATDTRFEKRYEGILHARETLAELLGAPAGGRWLRLAGMRWQGEERVPVCWTEIYVAEPYIAVRNDGIENGAPVYERIRRRFNLEIAEVEQRVSATPMPADIAALLTSEPGAPALLTRRRYFAEGGGLPFEVSLSLHPADRYAFVQTLRRTDGKVT